MRTLIDQCDQAETSRWRALEAGAAALVLALLLALAGFGLLSPSGAQAAGPFTFNDCASITASDIATAVSAGQSITYTGTTPCTVNLNQTTLTAPSDVVVNITIEGGIGLTLDESNVLQNEIDFSMVGANSSLTLDHVTLANNRIGIFAPGAASPSISVTNSTISSNGGGIDVVDAGSSSVTVTNSTVSGIDVEHISGVVSVSPTVTVTGSAISDKSGSGIDAEGTTSPHIKVTDSTISGNAFYGITAGDASGVSISVTNSTISGNTVEGINAGNHGTGSVGITITDSTISENGQEGIDVTGSVSSSISLNGSNLSGNGDDGIDAFDTTSPTISLTNITLSGNGGDGIDAQAATGSNISVTYGTISVNGAGIVANSGTSAPSVSVTATILADNTHGNCAVSIPAGPVTDGGYNLSTDTSCGFTSSTSLPNGSNATAPTDAQLNLLPLGSHGGPTQTVAFGPNSIAIDLIPASDCSKILDPITSQPITTDQRGIDRPQGSGCDAGAYEAPAVTIGTTPSSPASSGWYNASQLGAGGTLPVKASFTGLADGELPTCTGAAFSGLPASPVSGLNQTASGSASLGGGTYSISCGVNQDTTTLGVSQSPTQPVSLKVDTIPPTINLTSPTATNYELGQNAEADYSCSDATSQIATTSGCVGPVSNGSPIDTRSAGQHDFIVNAADQAGNTNTKSVTYTVLLPAPTLIINGAAPESSPYWYNLANSPSGVELEVSDSTAAVTGYSCTDNDQPLNLSLSSGTPPTGAVTFGDGAQTISCTATDGTNTSAATVVTIQVDRTPPTITLTTPADNATYPVGTTVYADFSCADATSQIATTNGCVGTFADGSPINTSPFGPHTFTVNAVDQAGNTAMKSVTYTVSLPAPALTINGQSAQASPYWYDLTNSPSGVTLAVSDSATTVTGYSCSDTIGTTTTDLPLTLAGTPPVGTAKLGDGVQTLSCTATYGTNTSAATTVMIQIDRTPPSGECSVPDQSPWYDHNVSVGCTPTDATSGLSSSTPNPFSLTTSVAAGEASASAATGSQQICDVAGNCQTIGPFDFKVDLAPPTVSSPVANASYIVNQDVTLSCADVGSGVNTCQVTVTLPNGSTITVSQGQALPTSQPGSYSATPNTVTDVAGNSDTTSFTYTVGYQIVTLPGNTQTVNRDYYALIRIYPADANGRDYASRNLKVTSIELDGPNGQVIPFAHQFQYATFSGKVGYQLSINTRSLSLGTWTLKIQIGSGNNASTESVTFTVE